MHIFRNIVIIMVGLLMIGNSSAIGASRKSFVPTKIRSWQFKTDIAMPDSCQIDTSYLNFPLQTINDNYSINNTYNANLVSPLQSAIYFERQNKVDFLFANAYQPYILTPQDIRYCHTTTPYSSIGYYRGFTTYHEENTIEFFFTGNLKRNFNLSMSIDYNHSVGHYQNQSGKNFKGSIYGAYNGRHYSCFGSVMLSTLSNFENGGIKTTDDIDEGRLSADDIPVNLNAMSGFKYVAGFWTHHYSLCVERERRVNEDSVTIDYIPVTTFRHTLNINNASKRYREKTANQNFYENNYFNQSTTNDTAVVLTIRNTLSVTFEEEFNKWLHFGATVYATNECQRLTSSGPQKDPLFADSVINFSPADLSVNEYRNITDTNTVYRWTNNTWIGGSLYKNRGKYIRYGFNGDVCLLGYKIGEFQVNGHLNGYIPIKKDTLTITANAYVKNEKPNYFLQHYRSNHFCWDNSFGKVFRFYVGGSIAYPTKYVQLNAKVGFENITHNIYFAEDGLPVQNTGNVQVVSVDATANIRTKYFNFDNNIVWQLSSSSTLPLPQISIYANWYYHGHWFKALDAQIGVDMRYNTAYYAPLLNPATGQFCVQDTKKVGNYPILGVYANFYPKLIKLKFFINFTHFNYYFMKNKDYYTMPNYPLNPPVIRAGLAWHFNR
ncbi:MAG: putative porin [Paludibacteraceae bacterium]|nr:putative porin [Paludibacteraceae bacterium]